MHINIEKGIKLDYDQSTDVFEVHASGTDEGRDFLFIAPLRLDGVSKGCVSFELEGFDINSGYSEKIARYLEKYASEFILKQLAAWSRTRTICYKLTKGIR